MPYDPNYPADNSPATAAGMRAQLAGLKSLIDAGGVPIGLPQPYLKNLPGMPALPANWAECNGQVLVDVDSPLNGVTIPDLNGALGGAQRFLRGAATSGGTGGADTHTHTLSAFGSGYLDVGGGGGGGYAINADRVADSTSDGASAGLPSYYEVVWVMRVK